MTEASAHPHTSDGALGVGRAPAGASRSWFQQRPWVVDLVVVLAVFTYNLPIQMGFVPDGLWPGTGVVVSLGLCAPYLARRRYPLGVFCAVLLSAVVQVLLGVGLLVADVMLLFALYNLTTRLRWTVTVPAAASVAGWLLVAAVPSTRQGYTNVGDIGALIVVIVWAWTWGTLVKTRQAYIDSLRERARQLEREREAQAKVVAAQERARIAREIHDIVSHSLSVVVVMADGAAAKGHSEPGEAALTRIHSGFRRCTGLSGRCAFSGWRGLASGSVTFQSFRSDATSSCAELRPHTLRAAQTRRHGRACPGDAANNG